MRWKSYCRPPEINTEGQNGVFMTELNNKLKNKKEPNRSHTKNWITDIIGTLKVSKVNTNEKVERIYIIVTLFDRKLKKPAKEMELCEILFS